MPEVSPTARQPVRERWSLEKLIHARNIALGMSIAPSTAVAYSSYTQSWINFARLHEFAMQPTADSLSFFIVFMSHHIKPSSVASYLSGIVNQLEAYFPDVRLVAATPLVRKTLSGMRRIRGSEVIRREPIDIEDVRRIILALQSSPQHDDKLFLTMILTAFFGLMRSGELAQPDRIQMRDTRRLTPRHTIKLDSMHYEFLLPAHKGDRFFEGSRILIQTLDGVENPRPPFIRYLAARDAAFPYHPQLWLRADGSVPTYGWFTTRLKSLFPEGSRIGGQSLRAGGATRLAELGAAADLIQAAGRWSSEAFRIYIRKHPIVLQAMLFSRPAFQELRQE